MQQRITHERAVAAARQCLEADLLLGVGFHPKLQLGAVSRTALSDTSRPTTPSPHAVSPAAAVPLSPALPPATLSHAVPAMPANPMRSNANSSSVAHPAAAPFTPECARKAAALEKLRLEHDVACPHCARVDTHTNMVFGEGNPDASLMFIGEAPGEEEDRTGRPFVGRAGQKLDEIIKAMGLTRDQVYIANVLKARPPNNRTPLPHEVEACAPFLARQIAIIQPKVIVALGAPASKWLLKTETAITRLRGQWGSYSDGEVCVPVMPTFHPAYLLRNYTVQTRQQVWHDMQQVSQRLAQP